MKNLSNYVNEKLKINKNFKPMSTYNYKKGDIGLIMWVNQTNNYYDDISFDIIKFNYVKESEKNKCMLWGDSMISKTAFMGAEHEKESNIDLLYHTGEYDSEYFMDFVFPEYRIESFLQAIKTIDLNNNKINKIIIAKDIFKILCPDIMDDIFNNTKIKEHFCGSAWQNEEYEISNSESEIKGLIKICENHVLKNKK